MRRTEINDHGDCWFHWVALKVSVPRDIASKPLVKILDTADQQCAAGRRLAACLALSNAAKEIEEFEEPLLEWAWSLWRTIH